MKKVTITKPKHHSVYHVAITIEGALGRESGTSVEAGPGEPTVIGLSKETWESLRAQTPEAVALKELLEAIDGAPGISNHVTPELASALQEARVLVRRMEDTSDEKE